MSEKEKIIPFHREDLEENGVDVENVVCYRVIAEVGDYRAGDLIGVCTASKVPPNDEAAPFLIETGQGAAVRSLRLDREKEGIEIGGTLLPFADMFDISIVGRIFWQSRFMPIPA